ncbi:Peptidase_C1 domain-containing protein/Granulin domain-containing protein/Inhibitor_I29 domain-containing protein [Cephalotus follicularis]|uniref:Peptidase_C1 domain-containing protein/Granulin domain-containing protein/Inhibitor_I29 domain-containing protein n=1 Tax=Cephalotus follicularis TaxID=3775 RepID=A0A1Q3BJ77_CEPFO|nr:Peptidase_C1 domain-containing protein/Granulin domain-containing protein/Inhibitor_I29 domain-containing protein [Cephalotus follicularis]
MGSKKNQLALLFFTLASVTCLCFGLPSEYSIIGRDLDQFVTEERVLELFQQWKEKHSKVYKHAEEAEKRLENFKRNLKYIIEKNAEKKQSHGFRVGLNKFADMSNEEFKKTHLSKVKKPITKKRNPFGSMRRKMDSCDAPSSLDWRKYGIVTGVKDQGECGSCWAFSTTGAIEGIDALVTGDLISLSEQELVDCDTTNDGCDGGYMDYAFEWIISNGGIDTESDYPYTSSDGTGGTCNVTKEETKVVTIDGYEDVDESDSALYCATAKQPISVGMDGSAIDFQLYTSGIYDGDCSDDPNDIDHAVLIVGYGSEDSEDYWIVKNSWGTSWGMSGYFYLRRNTSDAYGVCAVNAMASYPTKESSSPSPYPSPSPPPPPSTPPPPPPPDYSYCPTDETCCCIYEFFDYCLIYGCCSYENAVCCTGTDYCCPSDYPICDVEEGLCLKGAGDYLGIAARKRHMAKHKFPWGKLEKTEKEYQPLQWKRNHFAAQR